MEDIFVKNYRELKEKLKDTAPADKIKTIIGALRDTSNQVKERQDAIKSSTFQTDEDGTNYGVGNDGKTYSYTMQDGKMQNVKKLSADEQKEVINKVSNGKVEVNPDVTNQKSLTDILRSVNRMYQKGGNLVPGNVRIADFKPGSYFEGGAPNGITYYDSEGTGQDLIELNGLDYPKWRKNIEKEAREAGWTAKNNYLGEYVPTHELSHTAQNASDRNIEDWKAKTKADAEQNKNKYSIGELFKNALSGIFGQSYPLDESKSIGKQIENEALADYDKWKAEDKEKYGAYGTSNLINIAAKRAGFNNVKDAAKSISGYAGETYPMNWEDYGDKSKYEVAPEEVFAEAYTDVLLNGDEAQSFSKELIALYREYTDLWAERTGKAKDKRIQETRKALTTALNALPDFTIDSKKSPAQLFNQRYKMTIKK